MDAGAITGARRGFWIAALFVLLLRAPFLGHAVQGDDVYYLIGAQHALVDPLHPSHARFVFQGDPVDMRGHPHPPLNSLMLAGVLALAGDVHEPLFHAAYLLFSLLAAAGMWSLAGRFAPARRLEATLLFCAVPAFVVNGNSLEADLPFLAFWMAGAALFVARRLAWAALALALAALTAYQALAFVPILWAFVWLDRRRDRASWIVALTPALAFVSYQLYERLATGELPAEALAAHFRNYNLQTPEMKLKNAAALTGHLAVMLSPLGLLALGKALRKRTEPFLLIWIGVFFAAALVLFFAGSALPASTRRAFRPARRSRVRRPAALAGGLPRHAIAGGNPAGLGKFRAMGRLPRFRRQSRRGERAAVGERRARPALLRRIGRRPAGGARPVAASGRLGDRERSGRRRSIHNRRRRQGPDAGDGGDARGAAAAHRAGDRVRLLVGGLRAVAVRVLP
jgi:hypothetical protein